MEKHPLSIIEVPILEKVERYSSKLLTEELSFVIQFHNLTHTQQVVKAAEKIGIESGLKKEDLEIIVLAAWLHDTGYCYDIHNHEQESIRIAKMFLTECNYLSENIERVENCIAATKIPQNPQNLLEQILCDADLSYLGEKGYGKKMKLHRKETSLLEGNTINQIEWLKTNEALLKNHTFFTEYGRKMLSAQQDKNYKKIKKKTLQADALFRQPIETSANPLAEKEEKLDFPKPSRGIETMFRTTSHNHLELSAIADKKANIMISINSINISLIVSLLLHRLDNHPNLIIPTMMLTLVSLLSMVFAVLGTRPIITSGKFSRQDIHEKRTNLLFFGNFHHMPLEEYEWGIKHIMQDSDMLYSNMIHDIYSIGSVLGRKYHMLRICYNIFMYGIILSIIAYAIALIFFPVK